MSRLRSYYESLLSNPNVRKALNLISKAEGADYGTLVYFGTNNNEIVWRGWGFSRHPSERGFKMPNPDGSTSSASGRYQIVGKTWRGLQARGIVGESFDPREQDIAGIALIDGRGALGDVLSGNVGAFVQKSRDEWASFKVRPLQTLLGYWSGNAASSPGVQTYSTLPTANYQSAGFTLNDSQLAILNQKISPQTKAYIVWILALAVGTALYFGYKK